MIPVKINGQWDIILPEHRALRPEWKLENGGWEKARLEHIHSTTEPGDWVYYVGAEEGEMCALIKMWGANIVMFEPNKKVWPNIKAIWGANNLSMNDQVLPCFAANITARDPLWNMSVKEIQGEVIHDHGFKELKNPGDIPSVKIDDVVVYKGLIPNMISIDTEGSEWEVLQGAEKTIDTNKPRIYLSLHPEFLIDQYGKYSYEVRRWIIDKGYSETLLDWQHEAHFVYEPIND